MYRLPREKSSHCCVPECLESCSRKVGLGAEPPPLDAGRKGRRSQRLNGSGTMTVSTHKAIELSGIPLAEIALGVLVLAKNLHGNDARSACTIPTKTPKM